MARCFPAPDTWTDLHVDLTDGEETLARHLIDVLSEEWRLYLQPHVGGTRPDLAVVHPRAGVQLIEVKDYDLGAYDLSGDTWQVKTGDGLEATRSPFTQVDEARRALFRILLPFAEAARAENPSLYGFVRAGVYFHNASAEELETVRAFAKRSLGPEARHYGLAGRSALSGTGLSGPVPLRRYADAGSRHVQTVEARADDIGLERPWPEVLHGWLHPTPDEAAQNEPLELTPAQEQAAWDRAKRLLITGPAGSGKTLVLARRAAHALIRGRDVLLLSFNITLWHYVRDFVARGVRTALRKGYAYTKDERRALGANELKRRVRQEFDTRYTAAMRRLTITHYHALAYRMWEMAGGDRSDVDPETIAGRLVGEQDVLRRRTASEESGLPAADALLIDEGQDWGPRWLESLRSLLHEDSDITVAADPEQRIYDHAVRDPATLFQDAPSTAHLDGTARVPAALLPALNAVSNQWLGGSAGPTLQKARQVALDFSDRPVPEAVWTEARRASLLDCVVATAREQILSGVNASQIGVLVPTHRTGLALEPRFANAGIAPCSLCTEDPDTDKSGKMAFWRLDPRLKLSTVHSFKGWEADVIVVLLPKLPPSARERETLHVALTRTRAAVHVVAPPGGPDLQGWNYRSGKELLSEVPLPKVPLPKVPLPEAALPEAALSKGSLRGSASARGTNPTRHGTQQKRRAPGQRAPHPAIQAG